MFKNLYPTETEIASVMRLLRDARIGVLGDFCIDAYWELDSRLPEISIETGKQVQHVRAERYSPGGAGNVVVNLRSLGVGHIKVFAIIGNDVFGREMTRELMELGIDTSGLVIQSSNWATPVYGKPLLDGVEQQRLDFGLFNIPSSESFLQLTNCLCETRQDLDFLVINQQIPHGWCLDKHAKWMATELNEYWKGRHIVDARHFVDYFAANELKVNLREAAHVLGISHQNRDYSDAEALDLMRDLTQGNNAAKFLTRGERGIIAGQNNDFLNVPGVAITGPTDTVGAGDAATAMLAACGAAKLDPFTSAIMANLAASITVQKINQTGTATELELIDAAKRLSYVYQPTLAEEVRLAHQHPGTDIEIVDGTVDISRVQSAFPYRYAVFDHDGTISTLRQEWEYVMEPVMVHAILGSRYNTIDSGVFHQVTQQVRMLIEQTTGIQTIAQMDELAKLVDAFDIAPSIERQDAWGYKQLYNNALMTMVNDRIERLNRGELSREDFIMKGAVSLLRDLKSAGVTLFLVSGTDEADVIREAGVLGYADLFGRNIFGAKPGSRADTKDEIIRSLLVSLSENSAQHGDALLVIGDGPVEVRLGRRYGATSVGIASNEERRFGLNAAKRRRLIRAGANLITPDFTQWRSLVAILGGFRPSVPENPPQ